jgi:hypothetical protein
LSCFALACSLSHLPDLCSAYQAENLYYGLTGERLEQLDKQHIDPLMSAMKARGITLAEIDKYLMARRAKERNEAVGRLHPTFQRKACGERLARSGTIGFSGAVSGLSAHLTAGSSQLIH